MAYQTCEKCGKQFFNPKPDEDTTMCMVCSAPRKWHKGTRCQPTEQDDIVKCPKCGNVYPTEQRPVTLCHGDKVTGL